MSAAVSPIEEIIDYLETRLRDKQREYDGLHGEIVGLHDALTRARSIADAGQKRAKSFDNGNPAQAVHEFGAA
jgi:hypothetical protein